MEEESKIQEIKESLEKFEETQLTWNLGLALTTALIAVIAAIASLLSGNFANQALIEKNNAVLYQNKASDQYSWYQAKSIKQALATFTYAQTKDEAAKQDIAHYERKGQKSSTG